MNPENVSNASASGTTSASAPEATSKLSESEFLAEQARLAKAALGKAFDDLKADLARGADPRLWVKSHPWVTLASAAVAGFAATSAAIPSREEQALARLRAIERAIHGAHTPRTNGHDGEPAPAKESMGAVLTRELIGMAKPIVVTLLSSLMASAGQRPPVDPSVDPATAEPHL